MKQIAAIALLAACAAPAFGANVRFATYNLSLNRNAAGQLQQDLLGTSGDAQATNRLNQIKTVAEVIQRNAPDVLLLNEFDYDASSVNRPIDVFADNYLKVSQNTLSLPAGGAAQNYPHRFIAPSNTGIHSGFDLNNNGAVVSTPGAPGYGDDAFGFGNYAGQFGMAVVSKYEIVSVRTFQNFKWKDMPGNLLTNDPTIDNAATPVNENLGGFYSADEQAVLRLSSKSHWDVSINVNGTIVHVLTAHPTPPVFDGTEDRNGKRNYDEIRFWKDYVNGASYMYDDAGMTGGLSAGEAFVIMGDYNADPFDGDAYTLGGVRAIDQLLADGLVDDTLKPESLGAVQAAALQGAANLTHLNPSKFDTADFADGAPGNLRADYVLPSVAGLDPLSSGVFWPEESDPLWPLVGKFSPTNFFAGFPSSDHKLVFANVTVVPEPTSSAIALVTAAGLLRRRR